LASLQEKKAPAVAEEKNSVSQAEETTVQQVASGKLFFALVCSLLN
jgi:hypothetical protein